MGIETDSDSGIGSDGISTALSDNEEMEYSPWDAKCTSTSYLDTAEKSRKRRRTKRNKNSPRKRIPASASSEKNTSDVALRGDSSAHSLVITEVKGAVERLLELMSDLRRRCSLFNTTTADREENMPDGRQNENINVESIVPLPAYNKDDDSGVEEEEEHVLFKKHSKGNVYQHKGGRRKAKGREKDETRIFRFFTCLISILVVFMAMECVNTIYYSTKSSNFFHQSVFDLRPLSKIAGVVDIQEKHSLESHEMKSDKDLDKNMPKSNERELFNPMVGRFWANPSDSVQSFFSSKLRWRGEFELAEFARKTYEKQQLSANSYGQDGRGEVRHVNMLLTEQPVSSIGSNSSSDVVTAANHFQSVRAGSPIPSGSSRVVDPSLMDYEVIDVYWRRDIEQEKGGIYSSPIQPLHHSSSVSNVQNSVDTDAEQFERDLQLLTEKSLFVPLNDEEQYRYENLSKAYYTDFYRTVGRGVTEKQNGDFELAQSHQPDPFASEQLLPSSSTASTSKYDLFEQNVHTATTSNGFSQEHLMNKAVPREEERPEEFFQNLAKGSSDADVLPPLPIADFGGGAASCGFGESILLNNVSLSSATCENLTGNVTEFFNFDSANSADNDNTESNVENLTSTLDSNILPEADSFYNELFGSDNTMYGILLDEGFGEPSSNVEERSQTTAEVDGVNSSEVNPELEDNFSPLSAFGIERMRYDSTMSDQNTPSSSGIHSAHFASSPSHSSNGGFSANSDFTESRFYDKLAPSMQSQNWADVDDSNDGYNSYIDEHNYYAPPPQKAESSTSSRHKQDSESSRDFAIGTEFGASRRGRRSKDEELAVQHNLPASAEEITRMTHLQIQRILRDSSFSATQKALVKKIRRRGRNKVAARKCRERRVQPTLNEREEILRAELANGRASSSQRSTDRGLPVYETINYDDEFEDDFDENYTTYPVVYEEEEERNYFAQYRQQRAFGDGVPQRENYPRFGDIKERRF